MTRTATKMKKTVSIFMVILALMSVFAVFAVPASREVTMVMAIISLTAGVATLLPVPVAERSKSNSIQII